MSPLLRIKLGYDKSLRSVHLFLRTSNSFSSTFNGGDDNDFPAPAEPIANRPLRGQSKFSKPNRRWENDNRNSVKAESDDKFLERLKLGFDRKAETPPKPELVDNEGKTENVEQPPQSAPEDADEIFKKIKETGLIPNAVAMLDGLCKDGLVQEAMKLFGSMREKGAIPEVVIYTAVVEGFCKAHKFDDAKRIFKKMQSNGVIPNAFSYGVFIRGLCKGKMLEDAYAVTIEMLEAGHSPNLATFTGLVDIYCRERGLEDSQKVIGEMKQKGFFVEEKAVREYLDKKGPFLPLVWEAILGKNASKRPLF